MSGNVIRFPKEKEKENEKESVISAACSNNCYHSSCRLWRKKEEAPAATTAASAEAESTAGGQPEGEIDKSQLITIYTNNGSEGRDVWLVDRAAEAGYNVQVVGLGALDVANRMIAEKNNPLCDVVFGLNSIEFEKLKAQDLLQTWEPDWTDGVDASLIDRRY